MYKQIYIYIYIYKDDARASCVNLIGRSFQTGSKKYDKMEHLELMFENADGKLKVWLEEIQGSLKKMKEFKKKFQTTLFQSEQLLKKIVLLLYFAKLLQMIDATVLQMEHAP